QHQRKAKADTLSPCLLFSTLAIVATRAAITWRHLCRKHRGQRMGRWFAPTIASVCLGGMGLPRSRLVGEVIMPRTQRVEEGIRLIRESLVDRHRENPNMPPSR